MFISLGLGDSGTLAETVGFGDLYVHHPLLLRMTVSQAV